MSDSPIWSVDSLAASNLLAALGIEPDEKQLEQVAAHFARHRAAACEWAAERAQSNALEALEAASMRLFRRRDDQWVEGFERAEQIIMAMETGELVNILSGEAPSKGQVLRAMIRDSRDQRKEL